MQEDNREVDPTQGMDEGGQKDRKIEQNRINISKESDVKNILQDNDKAMHEHIHEDEDREDILKIVMENEELTITLLSNVTEVNNKTAIETLDPCVNSNSESNIPKKDQSRVIFTNYYYFDAKLDLYIPRNILTESHPSQVIKCFNSSFSVL